MILILNNTFNKNKLILNNLCFKPNIVSYFVYINPIMKIVSNKATAEPTIMRFWAINSAFSALYNTDRFNAF